MAELEGAPRLAAKFRAMSLAGRRGADVELGYAAPYAVYVHENLEAYHEVGRAKFLEAPWRYLRPVMRRMIADDLRRKRGLAASCLRVGTWFLNTTRPLVPVDTGFLRSSGYVRVNS